MQRSVQLVSVGDGNQGVRKKGIDSFVEVLTRGPAASGGRGRLTEEEKMISKWKDVGGVGLAPGTVGREGVRKDGAWGKEMTYRAPGKSRSRTKNAERSETRCPRVSVASQQRWFAVVKKGEGSKRRYRTGRG